MMDIHRMFLYGFAMIQVAFFLIIFQELYDLGAITRAQAEATAFLLSVVTLLILATVINDLLKPLSDKSNRPHTPAALIIPVALAAVFGYGLYTEAPTGMKAQAIFLGVILALLATYEIIFTAKPVYGQVVRLERWLQERGIE